MPRYAGQATAEEFVGSRTIGTIAVDPVGDDRRGACATNANFPCALAALQLARAHAIAGDVETAHAEYERFIAQWKDADPSLPVLQAARAEYDKLEGRLAQADTRKTEARGILKMP